MVTEPIERRRLFSDRVKRRWRAGLSGWEPVRIASETWSGPPPLEQWWWWWCRSWSRAPDCLYWAIRHGSSRHGGLPESTEQQLQTCHTDIHRYSALLVTGSRCGKEEKAKIYGGSYLCVLGKRVCARRSVDREGEREATNATTPSDWLIYHFSHISKKKTGKIDHFSLSLSLSLDRKQRREMNCVCEGEVTEVPSRIQPYFTSEWSGRGRADLGSEIVI